MKVYIWDQGKDRIKTVSEFHPLIRDMGRFYFITIQELKDILTLLQPKDVSVEGHNDSVYELEL
jgi:hypothetical protein